jgi:AraC-like DNA-binding protein
MLQIDHRDGVFSSSAGPTVFVDECKADSPRVAVPSTGVQLIVRLGRHVPGGFDIHALGPRSKVHRKLIRGGQCAIFARLPLGTCQAILGKPASEFVGHVVALRDLWDAASRQRLEEQLAVATDTGVAVAALKAVIAERLEPETSFDRNIRLVQSAARRLERCNVVSVADELGVSERHLRRVFGEVVGLSPKMFFKLVRFERALKTAKASSDSSGSDIAMSAGYYDQAHMIADFRSIAGATPRQFLAELRSQS